MRGQCITVYHNVNIEALGADALDLGRGAHFVWVACEKQVGTRSNINPTDAALEVSGTVEAGQFRNSLADNPYIQLVKVVII